MKQPARPSLMFIVLMSMSLALTGCGGGGGGSSTPVTDPTPDDTDTMFSNPPYTESWGGTQGHLGVFTNAKTCSTCHTGTTTIMNFNGKDVSPVTEWKHGVMAHALNDPYYTAVVEEETHIFPDKKVFIEDTCLRCHAPMAYTHAHQNPELLTINTDADTKSLLPSGYAMANAMLDSHAREGVSCTACHQIQPTNLGDVLSMSGLYKINSPTENGAVDPSIFGPFTTPFGSAMQNNTIYTPQYAAHIRTSEMCATCHNLYTPTLDLAGEPVTISGTLSQFPEQAPYWEWLNSRYPTAGQNCQTCHMAEPEPNYTTAITTRPSNATIRPSTTDINQAATDNLPASIFSAHEMVGGNTYLLSLLETYMSELGIADKTTKAGFEAGFERKIAETEALTSKAATLEMGATTLNSNILNVPVTITNLTGHKLPTSYPSRRLWVHFTVTDVNNSVIFESGAVDSTGRIIAKDSAFTDDHCLHIIKDDTTFDYSTCYEPHHEVINNPTQVQIYESVLGDVNQDITHVLLHARQYLKDNRIPPQGWTLAGRHQNPVDTAIYDDGVVGVSDTDTNFANGANSSTAIADGKDTVTYQVNTSAATGPFTIHAELLYQPIRPSFVDGLHADEEITSDSHVARFKTMYQDVAPTPNVFASDSAIHNTP